MQEKEKEIETSELPKEYAFKAINENTVIASRAHIYFLEILKSRLEEDSIDWTKQKANVFSELEMNHVLEQCFEMSDHFFQWAQADFKYRLKKTAQEVKALLPKNSKIIIPGFGQYKDHLTLEQQDFLRTNPNLHL